MNAEELEKLVEDAAHSLGEHFEVVQIFVSSSDGEGTRCTSRGVGNYYARLGMAREFVEKDSHDMLSSRLAHALKKDED